MSTHDDHADWLYESDDDDDDYETCNRCGTTGLHWERAWSKTARREKNMLHDEDGRVHVCPVDLDAFDDLTGEQE